MWSKNSLFFCSKNLDHWLDYIILLTNNYQLKTDQKSEWSEMN